MAHNYTIGEYNKSGIALIKNGDEDIGYMQSVADYHNSGKMIYQAARVFHGKFPLLTGWFITDKAALDSLANKPIPLLDSVDVLPEGRIADLRIRRDKISHDDYSGFDSVIIEHKNGDFVVSDSYGLVKSHEQASQAFQDYHKRLPGLLSDKCMIAQMEGGAPVPKMEE
ncbi:MAG: hypothetical protein ACR2PR_09355 [Pseudohongiellaceae bacterium]